MLKILSLNFWIATSPALLTMKNFLLFIATSFVPKLIKDNDFSKNQKFITDALFYFARSNSKLTQIRRKSNLINYCYRVIQKFNQKNSAKIFQKSFAIFLIFSLCNCGFQVIYKERKDAEISYTHELAAIRIKKDRNRLSQELKNNLYDLLNPDYLKIDAKYFLTLSIEESLSPTFISSTGASGRNKVTLNVKYELKNLATATIISNGSTSVNDNYNVSSNRYGTYSAENYVRNNLTKIAAQNIRNSLVNDFIETQKKCEEEVKKYKDFICPLRQLAK